MIDESLSEDGEALELNGKFIGDEGIEALVSTNRNFDIENLDLSKNKLTWRGAHYIFANQQFKKLKRLYLGDNNISDKGIKALPKANFCVNLSLLDLRFNNIGPEGANVFVECDKFFRGTSRSHRQLTSIFPKLGRIIWIKPRRNLISM